MTAPLYPACPQLRSHVSPRVVDALAAGGYHVHRVGQAAYLHQTTLHLILGVWDRHDPPPAWADRLGSPSAGYVRRARRLDLEHRDRAYLRDRRGRFLVRLPWCRVPSVQVYSFDPAGMSLVDAEELRAAERRAELRNRGYWA